jgi:hypothetical protein
LAWKCTRGSNKILQIIFGLTPGQKIVVYVTISTKTTCMMRLCLALSFENSVLSVFFTQFSIKYKFIMSRNNKNKNKNNHQGREIIAIVAVENFHKF